MNDDARRDEPLDAGAFSSWVIEMQGALRGERAADVPCGSCSACCTSSQFVHIGPDEADTLAHIPAELLFPAPGLPGGHVLLGYDERGHCPMLVEDRCSIYEHRPRTCRTYDCRVFPAAGLDLTDDAAEIAKQGIAVRSRRWRFTTPTIDDLSRLNAVRAAASHIAEHAADWPEEAAPATVTQHAVLAVEIHEVFLDQEEGGRADPTTPDAEVVLAEVVRLRGSR